MPRIIQKEIEKLKKHTVHLGAVVEENLQRAVKSLLDKDPELAAQVIRIDKKEIDRIEIDLEEECLRIMALYQPVASDLRFLVTVLKINNDLERIGDLAAKVADKVILLQGVNPSAFSAEAMLMPEMFCGMYEKTLWMFRRTMDAFVDEDTDLAYKVCLTDDEVDDAKQAIRLELEEIITRNPDQHVYLAKLLGVARCMERIADHCTSICEDIIYMAQGKIVRHGLGETFRLKAES